VWNGWFRHQSAVNDTTTDFALDGQYFVREMHGGVQYAMYLTRLLHRRETTGATLRWYVYDGLGFLNSGTVARFATADNIRTCKS